MDESLIDDSDDSGENDDDDGGRGGFLQQYEYFQKIMTWQQLWW